MQASTCEGLPAAPGNSPAPGELKSGEGATSMRIEVRPDEFGFYDVVGVKNPEMILKEIEKRGVLPAVSEELLNAYLARLRGEATIMELELLDRNRLAVEFLESITEVK